MLSKRAYCLVLLEVLVVLLVVIAPALSQSDDFCSDVDVTGIPKEECEALLAIIEANPDFTKWVDEDHTPINNSPCTWLGVTCENGRVVRLVLIRSRLSSLPPEIGQLSNLTAFNLFINKLTELPPEIGQLHDLQGLYLGSNQLAELPPEIGQLNVLYILDLVGNHLTQLPSEIGQLTSLGQLMLGYNQFAAFPSEVIQLDNLWFLELANNQIISLPPEIGQFASLRVLDLSDNQLTELPPEMGQIQSLCALNVQNNQLSHIPVEFVPLLIQMMGECRDGEPNPIANPYMLLVGGNPLVSPPPEVVEQGHEAILDYLQDEARSDSDTQLSMAYIAMGIGFLSLLMLLGYGYRRYKQKISQHDNF